MTDEIILPYDNPEEAALVAEYEAWLKEQGGQVEAFEGDACELAVEPFVTEEQNRWLADYIIRWDEMRDREDAEPDDQEEAGGRYCNVCGDDLPVDALLDLCQDCRQQADEAGR